MDLGRTLSETECSIGNNKVRKALQWIVSYKGCSIGHQGLMKDLELEKDRAKLGRICRVRKGFQ